MSGKISLAEENKKYKKIIAHSNHFISISQDICLFVGLADFVLRPDLIVMHVNNYLRWGIWHNHQHCYKFIIFNRLKNGTHNSIDCRFKFTEVSNQFLVCFCKVCMWRNLLRTRQSPALSNNSLCKLNPRFILGVVYEIRRIVLDVWNCLRINVGRHAIRCNWG